MVEYWQFMFQANCTYPHHWLPVCLSPMLHCEPPDDHVLVWRCLCLHCLRQHLAHSSCGGSSAPTHVTLCSRCFHLLKCPLTLPNHTRPTLHDAWLTSPSLKCSLFPHINLLPLPLSYQYCPPKSNTFDPWTTKGLGCWPLAHKKQSMYNFNSPKT